ncbi:MAG: hypothetical protein LBC88_05115, partial [Spirochaetaceae bacterium]|nr:hypothetical protein [Spirochaetaceae bacterium]
MKKIRRALSLAVIALCRMCGCVRKNNAAYTCRGYYMGTSKNRLFSEVPLRFLALWAAKHAFLSGSSLKTEVFRDA